VELYGRPAAELGLVPRPAGGSSRDRLLGELAAAAAAGDAVVGQWRAQVAAALRLDDELGAAGAGDVTAALVVQLSRTLRHTLGAARRSAVALPLAAAAALAGRHALDRDDPAAAWAHHDTAAAAGATAGSAAALAAAAAGRAEVLRELGDPDAAHRLLGETRTGLGGAAGAGARGWPGRRRSPGRSSAARPTPGGPSTTPGPHWPPPTSTTPPTCSRSSSRTWRTGRGGRWPCWATAPPPTR
jgi:hypothetical protein